MYHLVNDNNMRECTEVHNPQCHEFMCVAVYHSSRHWGPHVWERRVVCVFTYHLWSICLSWKFCHVFRRQWKSKTFSETTPLQSSSTPSVERLYVQSAIFLCMRIVVLTHRGVEGSAFISLCNKIFCVGMNPTLLYSMLEPHPLYSWVSNVQHTYINRSVWIENGLQQLCM